MSLRRLKLDRIELFQLHRIDPKVPADEQFGLLRDLQMEGKVHHVGLSEVSVSDIEAARKVVRIVTVQNLYNLSERKAEPVVDYCDREGARLHPVVPDRERQAPRAGRRARRRREGSEGDPVAGRAGVAAPAHEGDDPHPPERRASGHLEENCGAAAVKLSDAQFERLKKIQS